ncbi:heme ABC transporter permease [Moraxella caviae]|uniref:Heme exporter protein C n=1 Tax=Moraxella caviae TaxID=34060 RepID=A0A1T0A0W2_9GAMM|nr:heme ABC transporter permease [Moraxella caviae]OOR89394.1 heme ABC transporter permease [Moraxella caviae]STZ09885.1 Cytochrome c-type biogenesis protein CcmC [Moraxella caviae]VEW12935.1 Cytochrome c-type biogenesis protein CcmC [Moraxella caviae]
MTDITPKATSKTSKADSLSSRLWQGFLTTVGTERFFHIFSPWVKWLGALAAILLGVGTVWGLGFAPIDYLQGNSYRIIFIHVPAASLAMSVYLALAVLGVIFLVWKIKTASLVAQAIAPIGFCFCVLSLLTGAIWAKPTWGTYWVWDARLTSMLILAFLYAGVMALFSAFEHSANRGKAAAVLSIVGAVNLPIIKYSVDWWNTLHQGATFTLTSAPKMSASMWVPLLIMMIGTYCLVAALAIYRTNTLILSREHNKAWVQRLLGK